MKPNVAPAIITGTDGEAVEAVGEVHRVADADDDEGAEGDEAVERQVEQEVLEEGQRQRRLEMRRRRFGQVAGRNRLARPSSAHTA